jgi:rubrerythrin
MSIFTADQALEMAMEIEKNGEIFYKKAAEKIEDPETQALFEDLAKQEIAHYKTFQRLAGDVKSAPSPQGEAYDQYEVYLHVALENALFAGPEKALALAEKAQDRETALRAAMGFEKDTLLFFYDLREMVGEKDQETIAAIIREEKRHLRRLSKLL